jgi:DNA invertase Pin-like site-specific DNA recombinase
LRSLHGWTYPLDRNEAHVRGLLAAARAQGWGDRKHPSARARARQLRDGGCYVTEIAELFGVSHTAIANWTRPEGGTRARLITDKEWQIVLAIRSGRIKVNIRPKTPQD